MNRRRQPGPAKKTNQNAKETQCVPWTIKEEVALCRSWTSWIRAKETPGWVPDFMEENDDEEQSDIDSKEGEFKVHDTGIYDGDSDVEEARETLFEKSGKKENNLDEEHKDKQEKNLEDPFNIYKFLKKKKDTTENEINSEL
ncbi:hypothetical protein Tco_0799597 [Tanacetum coccineum]|uniref:Uncharacterized protein n=1 Tax=Tanacetum coccineum TaxID=301880 RepID=A0ABQ4ZQR9_9ASTR